MNKRKTIVYCENKLERSLSGYRYAANYYRLQKGTHGLSKLLLAPFIELLLFSFFYFFSLFVFLHFICPLLFVEEFKITITEGNSG